jgi:hypothetical protein
VRDERAVDFGNEFRCDSCVPDSHPRVSANAQGP